MMKYWVLALATAAVAAPVTAQAAELNKPFRAQVGVYIPSDKDVRDALDDYWLNLGLSYDLKRSSNGNAMMAYGVYLDSAFREKNGNRVNAYGIGAFARWETSQFYYGLGAGIYFADYDFPSLTETDNRFGGKAFVGFNVGQSSFFEVGYNWIGKKNDVDPSGWSATFGFKF
jgi:hypothetical protein